MNPSLYTYSHKELGREARALARKYRKRGSRFGGWELRVGPDRTSLVAILKDREGRVVGKPSMAL